MPKTRSPSRFATAAVSLEFFLSLGALAGGAALMLAPGGEIVPLPVSALKGSLASSGSARLWRPGWRGAGMALLIWMAATPALHRFSRFT